MHLSATGQATYAAIIKSFVERKKLMLEALDPEPSGELVPLFG